MRLSTKNVLLMIALLSVNFAEGNKCIVRPSKSLANAAEANNVDAAEPIVIEKGLDDSLIENNEPIVIEEPIEQPSFPPLAVLTTPLAPLAPKKIPTTTTVVVPKTTTAKKTTTTTIKKVTTLTTKASEPTSAASSKSGKSLPDITNGISGKTTRYWDCCLASCAWKENTKGAVVKACAADGVSPITKELYLARNGCEGGEAYMCNSNQPWAINDKISYGFVAAAFQSGGGQAEWCCSCYRMQFTSGNAKGKQMIVQVTNTGYDLSDNHFDIQMPGGGVGVFNGCQSQWNTSVDGWGQRYGGISSRSECANLPKQLQDGCYWRFDWFLNSDNPSVVFERVQCPTELTAKSGCVPNDNSNYKPIPWN